MVGAAPGAGEVMGRETGSQVGEVADGGDTVVVAEGSEAVSHGQGVSAGVPGEGLSEGGGGAEGGAGIRRARGRTGQPTERRQRKRKRLERAAGDSVASEGQGAREGARGEGLGVSPVCCGCGLPLRLMLRDGVVGEWCGACWDRVRREKKAARRAGRKAAVEPPPNDGGGPGEGLVARVEAGAAVAEEEAGSGVGVGQGGRCELERWTVSRRARPHTPRSASVYGDGSESDAGYETEAHGDSADEAEALVRQPGRAIIPPPPPARRGAVKRRKRVSWAVPGESGRGHGGAGSEGARASNRARLAPQSATAEAATALGPSAPPPGEHDPLPSASDSEGVGSECGSEPAGSVESDREGEAQTEGEEVGSDDEDIRSALESVLEGLDVRGGT